MNVEAGAASGGSHIVVPAREARAVVLTTGDRLGIVDIEGGQVADVFVFAEADMREYLSAAHTRAHSGRLFPEVGGTFVTNERRPILALLEDTSSGIHDMLMAACDPRRYAALGYPDHGSCVANLHAALSSVGRVVTDVPQPINAFMNVPVGSDGTLSWLPAESLPGQSITLEALLDCVVVVSACPQDLIPINGGEPTALGLEVSRARSPRTAR